MALVRSVPRLLQVEESAGGCASGSPRKASAAEVEAQGLFTSSSRPQEPRVEMGVWAAWGGQAGPCKPRTCTVVLRDGHFPECACMHERVSGAEGSSDAQGGR